MKSTPCGTAGTTLAEVLVAMLFVAILGTITVNFVRTALLSVRILAVKSAVQEEVVMVVDLMRREVRMAGFGASGRPVVGIRTARYDAITVAADVTGDADVDDANELIAYAYDAVRGQLVRGTGGAPPQPFVSNVPADGLQMRYFAADGTELPAVSSPDATQAATIRRVDVSVRVERPNPNAAAGRPLRSVIRAAICRRNP
jgi:Tfp pilus assembly protein PilE